MAPEQLTGGVVDERSDLFSLGVITVEALTGRLPFSGKTHHELLTSTLHQPFAFESGKSEAAALNGALQKSLAKEPKDRFTSAAEMRQELIPAMRQYDRRVDNSSPDLNADTAILKK